MSVFIILIQLLVRNISLNITFMLPRWWGNFSFIVLLYVTFFISRQSAMQNTTWSFQAQYVPCYFSLHMTIKREFYEKSLFLVVPLWQLAAQNKVLSNDRELWLEMYLGWKNILEILKGLIINFVKVFSSRRDALALEVLRQRKAKNPTQVFPLWQNSRTTPENT